MCAHDLFQRLANYEGINYKEQIINGNLYNNLDSDDPAAGEEIKRWYSIFGEKGKLGFSVDEDRGVYIKKFPHKELAVKSNPFADIGKIELNKVLLENGSYSTELINVTSTDQNEAQLKQQQLEEVRVLIDKYFQV